MTAFHHYEKMQIAYKHDLRNRLVAIEFFFNNNVGVASFLIHCANFEARPHNDSCERKKAETFG